MSFSERELWTLVHGMVLGAVFLLAFAGGLADLYGLRAALVTGTGVHERMRRLKVGVTAMAVTAWATVVTGTWVVYPWYRDPGPDSSRSRLLADPATAEWHTFGMEWKEHIAWISPILATVVAFVVLFYGDLLIRHQRVRRTAMTLFVVAFLRRRRGRPRGSHHQGRTGRLGGCCHGSGPVRGGQARGARVGRHHRRGRRVGHPRCAHTLAEASASVKEWLTWSVPVGPLSGKVLVGIVVWLVSWAVLHLVLRHKPVETTRALVVALLLVVGRCPGHLPAVLRAVRCRGGSGPCARKWNA